MMNNSKIGIALVGGYLLGRTKKAKMAIGLGMFVAGKKLNLNPQHLARTLANSPVVGGLTDQVRKDLVDGTKSALTSAVTQRANSFADSLHERTLDINDPARSVSGSDDAAEEDAEDEGAEDRRDERVERDEDPPGPRRKAASAAGKPAKTAKSAKSDKTANTAKTAKSVSGKAGSNRPAGAARKTAGSGAGKAAAGAGRTAAKSASGTARKTSSRGGRNG